MTRILPYKDKIEDKKDKKGINSPSPSLTI